MLFFKGTFLRYLFKLPFQTDGWTTRLSDRQRIFFYYCIYPLWGLPAPTSTNPLSNPNRKLMNPILGPEVQILHSIRTLCTQSRSIFGLRSLQVHFLFSVLMQNWWISSFGSASSSSMYSVVQFRFRTNESPLWALPPPQIHIIIKVSF